METTTGTVTQEQVFREMEDALKAALSEITKPFEAAQTSVQQGHTIDDVQFLETFFRYAEKFEERCCLDFAEHLRIRTQVPQVRGTTSKALAREIRSEVFEEMDSILADYARLLGAIDSNFTNSLEQASNVSVTGSALFGALLGRVAGGGVLTGIGAFSAAAGALHKQAQHMDDAKSLLSHRADAVREQGLKYFLALPAAMKSLIDFAAVKCFGGTVDFELQVAVTQRLHSDSLRPAKYCQATLDALKDAQARALEVAKQEEIAQEERTRLKRENQARWARQAFNKQCERCDTTIKNSDWRCSHCGKPSWGKICVLLGVGLVIIAGGINVPQEGKPGQREAVFLGIGIGLLVAAPALIIIWKSFSWKNRK